MSVFLAVVIGFALGLVFGGKYAWDRGRDGKDFLFWKAPELGG